MQKDSDIEKYAAETLLQRGVRMKVRAPVWLRIIGIKTIGFTVKAPYIGTLHRVASYYLATGITEEQLKDITHEQALGLMSAHGHQITKAVACAWLNGYWRGRLLTRPLAAYLRWHCKPQEIITIAVMLLLYGGVTDFLDTTRSVRMMKITSPTLGQKAKGSQ